MQQRSRAVENHFNNDRFDESQGPRGRHSDLSHEADLVLRTCGECSMLSAVTWLLPIDSHQNFRAARATKLFCDRCFASMKKKCVTGPACSHTAFADESNREFCALRAECMLCVCVCAFRSGTNQRTSLGPTLCKVKAYRDPSALFEGV